MKSKATGTSMGGSIIYTKKHTKVIPCDCKKCNYRVTRGNIEYCRYYDIFSPNKSRCARYTGANPSKGKKRKTKK